VELSRRARSGVRPVGGCCCEVWEGACCDMAPSNCCRPVVSREEIRFERLALLAGGRDWLGGFWGGG